MTKGWFVTGTDTEIGKTTFSTLLLDYLVKKDYLVTGFKPVASGASWQNNELVNQDVQELQRHSNANLKLSQINPYCFEPAIAPHIAAMESHTVIHLDHIKRVYEEAAKQVDYVVVEGAGGILVPLHEDLLTLDLCATLSLPVIIVVGMRLGCINHALLTEKVILSSGLTVLGWVANQINPEMPYYQENITTLNRLMTSPMLAEIPYQDSEKKEILWIKEQSIFDI